MMSNTDNLEQLTRDLPRQIQPPRDLWPDILHQITRETAARGRPPGWLPLALAASLLVAVSSTVTLWLVMPMSEPAWQTAGIVWQDPAVLATRYAGAVEAEFTPARVALRAQLPRQLDRLGPEARDSVLNNLREIDTATQEIRGAIGRDPKAIYLVEMLVALYAREIDILRQLNQTTTTYAQETQL
jgi:hypothetical protein